MADPEVVPPDDRTTNGAHTTGSDADIDSLRAILLGPELPRIEALRARLDDPDRRAEDIGAVLPQVLMQHAHDPHLTRALTPPLERAITASVLRNPKPLADALFPVMGPAIRKAVSAGIAGTLESFNRALENSLSWRSLQWRMEAKRTGRSFAEVVLLKTMLYRVEQVFLIDRKSGLLLQHATAGSADVQDADMVSGMLTAIRDFVKDSFRVTDHDSLEALKVGELSVWIEPGPHAILAVVIRGSAPRELRRTLQDTLESIHLGFGHALENFSGDASTLAETRPALEACLQSQYRPSERKPRSRGAWLVLGIVTAAVLVWAGLAYRNRVRWNAYLDTLRAEPGLIVLSSERSGGQFVVTGMRDPLARDPQTLLAGTGLSEGDVRGTWAPYQALDSSLVLARAKRALQPPNGVTLTLSNGVLSASGTPSLDWIADARRVAPFVAGVSGFDAAGALERDIVAAVTAIESSTPLFIKGTPRLVAGQDSVLRVLVSATSQLEEFAAAAGLQFQLSITGHTDQDGLPELNVPLSRTRAQVVRSAIEANALPHLQVTADGVGSTTPAVVSENEDDKQKNRRVAVRVARVGEPSRSPASAR